MIVELKTDLSASQILSDLQGLVLLDFGATACGPCKSLARILEELHQSHPELTLAKANVEEVPDLAMQFGVMSVPTVVFWKNSTVLQRVTGLKSKDFLENLIVQHL